MTTPHPYAHVLEPLARDAETQFDFFDADDVWRTVLPDLMLRFIAAGNVSPDRFRVKPDTIMIGQREVPKPSTAYSEETPWVQNFAGKSYHFRSREAAEEMCEAVRALLEGRP